MAKVEAILGSETGKAGKASSLEMLKSYYKAFAVKRAEQNTTPSVFGYGFNQGGQAATSAGFQASHGQPAFA